MKKHQFTLKSHCFGDTLISEDRNKCDVSLQLGLNSKGTSQMLIFSLFIATLDNKLPATKGTEHTSKSNKIVNSNSIKTEQEKDKIYQIHLKKGHFACNNTQFHIVDCVFFK